MKITYKTLMNKIRDGYAEIDAWVIEEENGTAYASATFFSASGKATRKFVEVTNCPPEIER